MQADKITHYILNDCHKLPSSVGYDVYELIKKFNMLHIKYHVDYFVIEDVENINKSKFILYLDVIYNENNENICRPRLQKFDPANLTKEVENSLIESLNIYRQIPINNKLPNLSQYNEPNPKPRVYIVINKDTSRCFRLISQLITKLKLSNNLESFEIFHNPVRCDNLDNNLKAH